MNLLICLYICCYLFFFKGIAAEINLKNEQSHIIFGVSYMCLKSLNECCCKLCPTPNKNELVFVQAGQEDFEEKTFHYLSNSLFDDEPSIQTTGSSVSSQQTPPVVNPEVNVTFSSSSSSSSQKLDEPDSLARSRNKYGIVDENYGLVRFGAVFMDSLVKRPSDTDVSAEAKSSGSINSTFLILYGIQINLSANLLHR